MPVSYGHFCLRPVLLLLGIPCDAPFIGITAIIFSRSNSNGAKVIDE